MARKPRKVRLDCHLSWLTKKVHGWRVLPGVTNQPVPEFCGAQAAVESLSRARIVNATLNLPFPTLSIQHLIDLIRDHLANAATLGEVQKVKEAEYAFDLLQTNGVTSKEDYDAAPASENGYTKNVEGLKHYKLHGYEMCYLKKNPLSSEQHKGKAMIPLAVDQIATGGPIYAWLAPDDDFKNAAHGIYRAPKEGDQLKGDTGRIPTHALLLYGFGAKIPRTSVFMFQNNWGVQHHVRGRGLLEVKAIMGVIVPHVVRNWD